MVRVRNYLSAKSLGSERTQAAIFSWIVDVYIHIPWPHCVTRSNLDSSSLSSSSRVYYYSLSYARDLFHVLQTPFVLISATQQYLLQRTICWM